MDADLQHPPEVIPRLLAACEAGADLAVASRYARGGSRHGLDGLGRHLVSRVAGALARVLFSEARATTDPLSGFFVCRRRLLDGIALEPVGFKILLELLVCVPHLRVADVPMRFAPRTAGVSKATAAQGRLYLRHLRSLSRRRSRGGTHEAWVEPDAPVRSHRSRDRDREQATALSAPEA